MSDGMLLLSWDSHHATFCDILSRLREKGSFTDVTLACEGKFYPLHKLVLSTCSEYLENIFEKTPCKHPVIVLNDIKCSELEALLSYMYAGEVSVPQSTLSLLIRAAELLQIKGLAVPDTPPSTSKKKIHACNPSHDEISPQAKRRRYEESNTSSQREQSQVLGGSLPSVTSLCGEKKQTSEHSKILTEGLEQEQVDQVIDHLQASEGSSFSQIEDVYIETDIKEEMVEDVDNTNTMRVSDPELDYQSHSSSCKMEDARVGPVTKDGCSFPVSEDYGKQPLDHQEILPPPTNVPDTSVSSTELQGWMTEGALGELSRLDGYSGAGIFESSSPIISQQGAPQQEQQMRYYLTNVKTKMMRKTKFNPLWLEDEELSKWVRKDPKSEFRACCILCGVNIELSNMGKRSLSSHSQGKKHQLKVDHFFKVNREIQSLP
ncbi:uncharacterized protein [Panulirus ornatus]|uniref:uncharacterized protein isoform X4 n=1 Tax=Panulirus ornatus TaxID=150431 RepID=UPI003A83E5FE